MAMADPSAEQGVSGGISRYRAGFIALPLNEIGQLEGYHVKFGVNGFQCITLVCINFPPASYAA